MPSEQLTNHEPTPGVSLDASFTAINRGVMGIASDAHAFNAMNAYVQTKAVDKKTGEGSYTFELRPSQTGAHLVGIFDGEETEFHSIVDEWKKSGELSEEHRYHLEMLSAGVQGAFNTLETARKGTLTSEQLLLFDSLTTTFDAVHPLLLSTAKDPKEIARLETEAQTLSAHRVKMLGGGKPTHLSQELVQKMEGDYESLSPDDKVAADARIRYLNTVTAGTSWNELSEQEREVHTATANRLGARAKDQYLENLKVNPAFRIIDEIGRLKQKVPAENTKEHEGFAEILAKANSQILFWKGQEGNNFKYVISYWDKDLTLGISDYSSFRLTTGNLEELLTRLGFLPDVSFDQLGNHTYHRLTDDELQQNERYPSIKRAPLEGAKNAYTYLLQSALLPGVTARVNRDVWDGKSSHMIFFEFSHKAIKQTLHHLPPQLGDDMAKPAETALSSRDEFAERIRANPAIRILDEIEQMSEKIPPENTRAHQEINLAIQQAADTIQMWGNCMELGADDPGLTLEEAPHYLFLHGISNTSCPTVDIEQLLTKLTFLPQGVTFHDVESGTYAEADDGWEEHATYPGIARQPLKTPGEIRHYNLFSNSFPGVLVHADITAMKDGKSAINIHFSFTPEAKRQTVENLKNDS